MFLISVLLLRLQLDLIQTDLTPKRFSAYKKYYYLICVVFISSVFHVINIVCLSLQGDLRLISVRVPLKKIAKMSELDQMT